MTCFRAPSTSSLSSDGSMSTVREPTPRPAPRMQRPRVESVEDIEANHQHPVRPSTDTAPAPAPVPVSRRLDKGKGRARSPANMARKKEAIRKAQKKATVLKAASDHKLYWSVVYVGNVHPSVREMQLAQLFSKYGDIVRVDIRVSSGLAICTADVPQSYSGATASDRHYATVQFLKPAEARKAIELNGAVLEGREIMVTFNPMELPETVEIIRKHLGKDPQGKRNVLQVGFGHLKRLTIERTEYIADPRDDRWGAGSPVKLVAGLARRLGLVEAGGDAEEDQKTGRYRLPHDLVFPKTLD